MSKIIATLAVIVAMVSTSVAIFTVCKKRAAYSNSLTLLLCCIALFISCIPATPFFIIMPYNIPWNLEYIIFWNVMLLCCTLSSIIRRKEPNVLTYTLVCMLLLNQHQYFLLCIMYTAIGVLFHIIDTRGGKSC